MTSEWDRVALRDLRARLATCEEHRAKWQESAETVTARLAACEQELEKANEGWANAEQAFTDEKARLAACEQERDYLVRFSGERGVRLVKAEEALRYYAGLTNSARAAAYFHDIAETGE